MVCEDMIVQTGISVQNKGVVLKYLFYIMIVRVTNEFKLRLHHFG